MKQKFLTLYTLYSRVHKHLSHKDPVRENETNGTEDSISMYMTFYKARFPEVRIILRQHILEAHCVQWIGRWGFGLALHGEQGGEEIHATVNRIQRRASWGMRNDEDRLRLLMTEQLTRAPPALHATLPPKKKKKKIIIIIIKYSP